ncbi:MAG: hypothetical protein HQL14_00255 [Candidatus Omnitrophica bacterium]|nr:hypothetical protein [Candidatus Omnitrophota bacterium]
MKKLLFIIMFSFSWNAHGEAISQWESQGDFYFLTKNSRESFAALGAGANKFMRKYLTCDGVDFLVKGAPDWQDYGRLDLQDNHIFAIPIRSGMKLDEIHLLASGNFSNSYEHDALLHYYGDKYFYATVTALFVYQDGAYKKLSVPVFWDWFHLPTVVWSKGGGQIKAIGNNPVRKDCSMYHIWFVNPRPTQPVRDLLIMDSWLADLPFSDIFAVTIKSHDTLPATLKTDMHFMPPVTNAEGQTADPRTVWSFDQNFDGWVKGSSDNWDVEVFWKADAFGHKGSVDLPACNWAGDKYSSIEKKVKMPPWDKIVLQFSRHSALFSELEKKWSDGLLKVVIKSPSGQETVYEKIYSGEWNAQKVDLSKYKGQTVIIRFENHGGGDVRLSLLTSPSCDGEDALIDDVRLSPDF